MPKSSDSKWTNAFTRASVEAYLGAADAECVRIEAAIVAARARTDRAVSRQQQLDAIGVEPAWSVPGAPLDVPSTPDQGNPTKADQTRWLQPDAAAVSGD